MSLLQKRSALNSWSSMNSHLCAIVVVVECIHWSFKWISILIEVNTVLTEACFLFQNTSRRGPLTVELGIPEGIRSVDWKSAAAARHRHGQHFERVFVNGESSATETNTVAEKHTQHMIWEVFHWQTKKATASLKNCFSLECQQHSSIDWLQQIELFYLHRRKGFT